MDIEKYAQVHPLFSPVELSDLLVAALMQPNLSRVLDSGCGDGSLLYSYQQAGLLKDKHVAAVDLSETRLANTKRILGDLGENWEFHIDSAEVLASIRDKSIDIYISTTVIEHVDDRKFLAAADRVTCSGGRLYISTIFKKKYAWYFYRNPDGQRMLDPTHIREYMDDSELLGLPEFGAFEVLENKKKQLWYPIGSLILKLLGVSREKYSSSAFKWLFFIKVPIVGYYNWELWLKKR